MCSYGISYIWFFKIWSFSIMLKVMGMIFVPHPTPTHSSVLNYQALDYCRGLTLNPAIGRLELSPVL